MNSPLKNGRKPAEKEKSDRFQTASDILARFGISYATLSNWFKDGKIEAISTPGGKRLYSVNSLERVLSVKQRATDTQRRPYIYARVSSAKQFADLERQKASLSAHYPGCEIISDIGSGLNWKRKGFQRLLDLVFDNKVSRLVVSEKDRLCRFAFELLERILEKFGTELVVHRQQMDPVAGNDEEDNPGAEMAEDVLAIINYFVAKNNGLRSGRNRRERKQLEQQQKEKARITKGKAIQEEGSDSEEDQFIAPRKEKEKTKTKGVASSQSN
jgi:predicted site-specific integrase-resolvase